jgi:hypothetical protein
MTINYYKLELFFCNHDIKNAAIELEMKENNKRKEWC